jgi:hypothetical protein
VVSGRPDRPRRFCRGQVQGGRGPFIIVYIFGIIQRRPGDIQGRSGCSHFLRSGSFLHFLQVQFGFGQRALDLLQLGSVHVTLDDGDGVAFLDLIAHLNQHLLDFTGYFRHQVDLFLGLQVAGVAQQQGDAAGFDGGYFHRHPRLYDRYFVAFISRWGGGHFIGRRAAAGGEQGCANK